MNPSDRSNEPEATLAELARLIIEHLDEQAAKNQRDGP